MAMVVAVTFKLYRVWFQTMCQQQGEAWAPNNSHTFQPQSIPSLDAVKEPHTCIPWLHWWTWKGLWLPYWSCWPTPGFGDSTARCGLGGSLQLPPLLTALPFSTPLTSPTRTKPLTDLRPVVLMVGLSGLRNSNLPMPSRAPAPLVALAVFVALAGLGGPVVAVLPLAASVGLAAAGAAVLPCSSARLWSGRAQVAQPASYG
jgi:hypothetical protein